MVNVYYLFFTEKERESRLKAESPTRVTSPGGTPVSIVIIPYK